MKDQVADILRKNSLSVTDSRRSILNLFLSHDNSALRHSDIEHSLQGLDRVTIYRTLQAFAEKGIIHSIPGSDGAARYAVCRSGCEEGHHHDDHVHFVCTKCGSTQCLDDVHVPFVRLPDGFEATKTEMVVSGICVNCKR